MAAVKPMLGDIELELVQRIEMDDDQVLAQHSVPALEGDFLQGLGRRAGRVSLAGVMTGPKAGESLKTLRDKFRAGEPTPFVADIATATKVGTVLIEEMSVRELAGKPERFEYELTLREQLPPPKPVVEEPPPPPPEPPPPPPSVDKGKLIIEVLVKDQPDFDNFEKVVVSIEGTKQEDGSTLTRTLTKREGNKWTDEDVPPGKYKVNAVEANPLSMTDEVVADVTGGQAANKTVTLSSTAIIARAFIVHFRFDSAFLEPCMRAVLQDVKKFAEDPKNKDLKMLIVGHTDRTGSREYNQSLSERRARSVFAYVNFFNDEEASVREWDNLRKKKKPGAVKTINDSWDTREYQHILQDLGFYPGNVDGEHGGKTDEAVRAFRCKNGLPPGTKVDDQTWNKLITEYMEQDLIGIDNKKFFPNGSGILKWLGCGEDAPLPLPKPTRNTAFRPYRRVEILFVNAKELPCKVPEPDTYKLPEDGPKEPEWALGPGDPNKRHCFGSRECDKVKPPEWCIKADDETTITMKGSIKNEDGTPFTSKEGKRFVVTTSDGEFILIKKDGTPDKDGEQTTGEPKVSRTNDKGEFTIPDKRVGVYTLEVRENVIVRLDEQAVKDAKGNTVCKRLKSDKDELKVVVLKDPVLREIRLPVAVHLMRGLQFESREIRTCPDPLAPGGRRRQETDFFKKDDKAVRDLFEEVNTIWRQARVRFNVIDIIREVFTNPTINECDVDAAEFKFILKHCAYPEAVNVFLFGGLRNSTPDAGQTVSEEGSAELGASGSCVGDRANGSKLDEQQRIVILAHELGHYLNLLDVDASKPANVKRLMLPGTFTAINRELVETKKEPEISTARASKGAKLDCLPLKLRVTGATRVGGLLSHDFIVVASATRTVTINAVISDELLAVGKVEMEGGVAGANNLQRQMLAFPSGPPVEIKATYTPNSGGEPIVTRVFIRRVTFSVKAEGAVRVPDTTIFRANPDPNGKVKITAEIAPLIEPTKPNCMPMSLVGWENGIETDDPLRREVSKAKVSTTKITVTFAGIKREITIEIREVLLTDNVAPFDKEIEQVEIKGIVNSQLKASGKQIAQSNLFKEQKDSFFRARADVGDATGNTITAFLISTDPAGKEIDRKNITLTRTTGPRFISEPLLPIPFAIKSEDLSEVNFKDFKFIRTKAGGKVRLQRTAVISDPAESFEVGVAGRVVNLFIQTFTDANTTAKNLDATVSDIRRHISVAERVWAQAGVEIKERSIRDSVPDPGGLLDLARNSDATQGLTDEERRLLGTHPDCTTTPSRCPTRSQNRKDLNVYYLRDIEGSAVGVSYGKVIAMEGPDVVDSTLGHEIGHSIIMAWACTKPPADQQDHKDPNCDFWSSDNIMHRFSSNSRVDVDISQAQNIYQNSVIGISAHPLIVFES